MSELNSQWAHAIVDEAVQHGVDHWVLCPGSRNSPLTAAVAVRQDVHVTTHFDERGAAFAALGMAKATGRAAALLVTSGSAVANLMPAIVEARMDGIPLLVVTADRPPELIDCGANQSIDQHGIFGSYAPCIALCAPDSSAGLSYARSSVAWACTQMKQGPVQLNVPLRKPLEPVAVEIHARQQTRYQVGESTLSQTQLDGLSQRLNSARRPILVVGRLHHDAERSAARDLAEHLGWPVIADVLSGLRLCAPRQVIGYAEQLLRSKDFAADYEADLILHVGGPIAGKGILDWLPTCCKAYYIRVAPQWQRLDPTKQVNERIIQSIPSFARQLVSCTAAADASWLDSWQLPLEGAFEELPWGEVAAVRQMQEYIGSDDQLYISSSLPIRHFDSYGSPHGYCERVYANRGCSGIDGNVATVAGLAKASARRTWAVLGDLALLHDLNSLSLLRQVNADVKIVVLNNDGGAIFGMLPIREQKTLFRDYWQTPHGMDFEHSAKQFNLNYACAQDSASFASALEQSGSVLIEVPTDAEATIAQMKSLQTVFHRWGSTTTVQS